MPKKPAQPDHEAMRATYKPDKIPKLEVTFLESISKTSKLNQYFIVYMTATKYLHKLQGPIFDFKEAVAIFPDTGSITYIMEYRRSGKIYLLYKWDDSEVVWRKHMKRLKGKTK